MTMLITTTKGLMDPSELDKREGIEENDNERASWVEYWLDGELVHRSVDMHLKTGLFAKGFNADFGGQ